MYAKIDLVQDLYYLVNFPFHFIWHSVGKILRQRYRTNYHATVKYFCYLVIVGRLFMQSSMLLYLEMNKIKTSHDANDTFKIIFNKQLIT